jgi:hypothetical protein
MDDVWSWIKQEGDSTWAFLAFKRVANPGTMTFMVEFNQTTNTGPRPIRTAGDLLLRFEQDGNGNFSLTTAYKWTEKPASGTWPANCTVVPGYTPESAWCTVPLTNSGFVGASSADKLFAEGAVNLSAFDTVGDCRGAYGVMNVRSFAGESGNSSLKDYIEPIKIDVPPTCGALTIKKVDQFGDSVGGATYEITPNPIPGAKGDAALKLVVTDGGANDPDGEADGSIVISPAKPGTYRIEETIAPPGYLLPADPVWEEVVVAKEGSVTIDVVDPLIFAPPTVRNEVVATYDVDANWRVHKAVDRNQASVPEGTDAEFTYTVNLEALPKVESGWEVHGTLTVTNPNDRSMLVTVSSTITGDKDCTFSAPDESPAAGHQVTVDPGANALDYTCDPGADPAANGTSTGTVSWDAALYPSLGAVTNPVTATADYTFAVDQRTDWTTTVTDTFNGGDAEVLGTWNWNDVWNSPDHTVEAGSYTRSIPGVPGECTDYRNVARESADDTRDAETVTVCVGQDLDVTKDANLGFHRTYDWLIAKSGPGTVFAGEDENGNRTRMVRFGIDLTASGYHDGDWGLAGTIKVDNPNSWAVVATLSDTAVVDGRTVSCDIVADDIDPDTAGLQVRIPGETVDMEFTYSCTGIEQGDYVGTNTVTIDWTGARHPSPHTSASDTVDVQVTQDNAPTNKTITLTDLLDGTEVTLPQSEFDWDEVRALDGHTQTIHYEVPLGTEPGECTPHTNVVGIDQTGQEDEHTVQVCSPAVDKTVDASFGSKQLWDIVKEVDKTRVEIAQGGTATFTYTVTATPGKVVDDGSVSWEGEVTVRNPSTDTPLTVDVTDIPAVPGWTCAFTDKATAVEIAPGATATLAYECSGTGHQAGTNTATVSWGNQEVSTTVDVDFAARTDVADSVVTIRDDKTDSSIPAGFLFEADAADPSTWSHTYSIDKTGVSGECTTYTNTAVIDLSASPDPQDQADATLCVEKPVKVLVDVSGDFGRTYAWDIDKEVDKTRVEVDQATGEAKFDYTVQVRALPSSDSGWAMSGTVTVTNPNAYDGGAIRLTGGSLSSTLGGGVDCTFDEAVVDTVVPAGGSVEVAFTCTFTSAPSDGEVTAEFTWDPAGPATEASKSGTTTASFTIGSETNKTVDVVDDKTNPDSPVALEKGLVWSPGLVKDYTYSLTHQGVAGECVDFTNTAVVDTPAGPDPSDDTTVAVCVEKPIAVAVAAAGDFGRTYGWDIEKLVDKTRVEVDQATGEAVFDYTVRVKADGKTDAGWSMAGTVTVSNPNAYEAGAITLTGGSLSSTLGGGADCTFDKSVAGLVVPAGGSVEVAFTCTFTSAPSDGEVTAEFTWDPAGPATEASKSGTTTASFTIGSETNKSVDVVDDKTNPDSPVTLEKGLVWSPGLVKDYTYSLTHQGVAGECVDFTNTAVVDTPAGPDPSDDTTVAVCVEKPLAMDARMSGDLARAYDWTIDKSVDATRRNADKSGNATFTWTVVARAGAATDSGWRVEGTATITNPNKYADGAVTADVTAATNLGGGASCVVAGGRQVVLEPGGTATLPITCTFASQPRNTGTVTVDAVWDPAGPATTATSTTTKDVTLAVRSETNKVVDVVDDKTRPGQRVVLEEDVVWSPGLVRTYTYSQTLAGGAPGLCADYTNTAVIETPVGPDPQDSTAVRVCTLEVAPAEAFGKPKGTVRASCQGTVRARLNNRSDKAVVYRLVIGRKVHKVRVPRLRKRTVVRTGPFKARVVLKARGKVLDRTRIPARCAPPEQLPDTGLRVPTSGGFGSAPDRRF